eukprot:TRINITY_DN1575_c0_g1_i1.p1 TRINITY_DN1575_c0_g1~~TRINITY_DN1575_c0_g1_i1.p1  ORF type:complete len:212 (-),score=7.22 TRINITY_DN1575_c0_g1_i1:324-959(-)
MDARAYRLDFLRETDVFEVDFPRVMEVKTDLMEAAKAESADFSLNLRAKSLNRVSADITSKDWFEKLMKAGFDPARNTVWLLEGLLYYLADTEAREVLKTIPARCREGQAVLLADFMNECTVGLSAELKSNFQFYSDWPEHLLPSLGYSDDVRVSQIGDSDANFGLVDDDDPLNCFNKTRRLPRCLKTDPADGMPCRRLYLVQCSVSGFQT